MARTKIKKKTMKNMVIRVANKRFLKDRDRLFTDSHGVSPTQHMRGYNALGSARCTPINGLYA